MSEQPAVPEGLEFDLADKLRKSLRYSGESVQSMAEYLEVSRNTVGNWINGHTRPRPAELKMWALKCGVPYDWLIGDDGDANGSRITALMRPAAAPSTAEIKAMRKALGHDIRAVSKRGARLS